MPKDWDLIIIGAGVIGYSIAFKIKRLDPSRRIAVLGDPVHSLMASRAAAGMLAPYGECERADRFFEFCRQSLEKYPPFIEELVSVSGVPVFLSLAGSLIPSAAFEGSWEDKKRFFREHDIPHELWSASEVKNRVPNLSDRCGETLWAREGQVNNRELHDALVAASRKLGVAVLEKNVTGFLRDPSSIQSVVTDSGELSAGKYVLAAGSWSTQLGMILDVRLPQKPIKGQMCRVRVDNNKLPYTIHGKLTYIAPWGGKKGFVLGSTMEDRGYDPTIEEDVIQNLVDKAAALLPCVKDAPLIETWTGFRPAAEDEMPIMGRSSRYRNLYYSTGHFRNGILQTPNQADYMAALLLESGEEEIASFSPSRYHL